jgi:transposase InsO family protein
MSNRAIANLKLLKHIINIHHASRFTYGALKTWIELNKQGYDCGLNRVIRLRKVAAVTAKRCIRFKQVQSGRKSPVIATNILEQNFKANEPNTKWVSDTTFIPTRKGWLYLATVIDLYSRKVIGWSMSKKNDKQLVINALNMAIQNRAPIKDVICHSDQGAQYNSADYKSILKQYKLKQSMSRKGCCYDNAVAESFFNNIKNEMIWHSRFNNQNEARTAIFDYIEVFYNRQRIHQSLGYKTPCEFEMV